jgi:DNA-binding transcriptional LysR family regulator
VKRGLRLLRIVKCLGPSDFAGETTREASVGATRPDLNLLPIAVALYDELNVTRAAQKLGMSQPAVSKALRRLRAAFDDPLFVRGSTGLVATPRVHAIVRSARSHLQHLESNLLDDEPFDPSTSTKAITIAMSEIAEMAALSAVVEHFRAHAPKCPVKVASVCDGQLATGLEAGEVDLAAGYFPSVARRNFRQHRLSTRAFACLMRAGHPLWRSRLTISDYLAAKHILIRPAGRSQEVFERFIARRKIRRKIAVHTSSVLSVPFIVMETQLIATLPHPVATRFASLTPTLAVALPPFDLSYDVKLHWHRRFDHEPRSVWLREQLAAIFRNMAWLPVPSGPGAFLER